MAFSRRNLYLIRSLPSDWVLDKTFDGQFDNIVRPSLSLVSSSPSSLHRTLQGDFGVASRTGYVTVPLQYTLLYAGQYIFLGCYAVEKNNLSNIFISIYLMTRSSGHQFIRDGVSVRNAKQLSEVSRL